MIKNLLYSLFLHFLLLLAIYANFDLKTVDESKTSEVSVSLVAINGDDTSNKTKPTSEAKAEKESNSKEIKKEVAETSSEFVVQTNSFFNSNSHRFFILIIDIF